MYFTSKLISFKKRILFVVPRVQYHSNHECFRFLSKLIILETLLLEKSNLNTFICWVGLQHFEFLSISFVKQIILKRFIASSRLAFVEVGSHKSVPPNYVYEVRDFNELKSKLSYNFKLQQKLIYFTSYSKSLRNSDMNSAILAKFNLAFIFYFYNRFCAFLLLIT